MAASVALTWSVFQLFCFRPGTIVPAVAAAASTFTIPFNILWTSKAPIDVVASGAFMASSTFIFFYCLVSSGRKGLKRADP